MGDPDSSDLRPGNAGRNERRKLLANTFNVTGLAIFGLGGIAEAHRA